MTPPRRVAIAGLGLMGGSLAYDLTKQGVEVVGYDADADAAAAALASGAVADLADASLRQFAGAELIVLATPVTATPRLLSRLAELPGEAYLTDVGSTKRSTIAAAASAGLSSRFVGAHPLAGDHRSGWSAARAGLYRDATVFVCPEPDTDPVAIRYVVAFWESVGGRCTVLSAVAHDERMAWVSHLPQLTASALAAALADAGYPPSELGPGGRDTTRLAASSAEVWAPICASNADLLGTALDSLIGQLQGLRADLEAGDHSRLHAFFDRARNWAS